MATSSALTLRPIFFSSSSSSFSLSPFSLPKMRASGSLMASASKPSIPQSHLHNPFIPKLNPSDFSPISQREPDFLPFPNVVASLQVKTIVKKGTDEHKEAVTPPPNEDSFFLFGRVVFVEFPLVSVVAEMIIEQLLYLQGMNQKEPIYMYLYSTGTHNDDGDAVALEADGFAIYDTMTSLKNDVHTFLFGPVAGHAALLVAAGKKGKRYMSPHASALIQEPRMPAFGEMQTSDLVGRAREALIQRNKFVELIGKHTGNSAEKVKKLMKKSFFMDFSKAKEFGLVDKIFELGKDSIMTDIPAEEEFKHRARTEK